MRDPAVMVPLLGCTARMSHLFETHGVRSLPAGNLQEGTTRRHRCGTRPTTHTTMLHAEGFSSFGCNDDGPASVRLAVFALT